jgi:hypothetical protein
VLLWAYETSTACSPEDTSVAMPLQKCQQSSRSLPPEEFGASWPALAVLLLSADSSHDAGPTQHASRCRSRTTGATRSAPGLVHAQARRQVWPHRRCGSRISPHSKPGEPPTEGPDPASLRRRSARSLCAGRNTNAIVRAERAPRSKLAAGLPGSAAAGRLLSGQCGHAGSSTRLERSRLMRPRQRGDCSVRRAAVWLRLPLRRLSGSHG